MKEAPDHRAEVIGVYKRVTGIVWQRLSPTFGIRTINAIARNVIARKAVKRPALAALRIGPDGLAWEGVDERLGQVAPEELRAALDEFLDDFFEALATLIGRLVVGKIFKEADELATGDEQP